MSSNSFDLDLAQAKAWQALSLGQLGTAEVDLGEAGKALGVGLGGSNGYSTEGSECGRIHTGQGRWGTPWHKIVQFSPR